MLKVLSLHDTSCREYCERNHSYDIRVDLEPLLTDPKNDSKSESDPNHIFLERSSLDFLTFDLEFD